VQGLQRPGVQRNWGWGTSKDQTTPAKEFDGGEAMRESKRMRTNWILKGVASPVLFARGVTAQEKTVPRNGGISKSQGGAR